MILYSGMIILTHLLRTFIWLHSLRNRIPLNYLFTKNSSKRHYVSNYLFVNYVGGNFIIYCMGLSQCVYILLLSTILLLTYNGWNEDKIFPIFLYCRSYAHFNNAWLNTIEILMSHKLKDLHTKKKTGLHQCEMRELSKLSSYFFMSCLLLKS